MSKMSAKNCPVLKFVTMANDAIDIQAQKNLGQDTLPEETVQGRLCCLLAKNLDEEDASHSGKLVTEKVNEIITEVKQA